MNETLSRNWAKVRQYWNQVNKTQKIVFISGLVLIIAVIVILSYSFSRTQYAVAFTDLDADDAAAITSYLNTQGIKYKLSEDGKSIGVPKTTATEVKINVESQGLMKNGSLGYGIFRNNISSFGMTDNEFNLLSIDAKAGEIQHLINAMNGVSSSKVLINQPQQSVFLNDKENQSTASVVVQFKPGYHPDQHQIDTIFNLVSHSVPNLPPENITVSDQSGEFSPSNADGGDGLAGATLAEQQLQFRKQFEADIQKNVYALLSRVIGPDKVIVSVVSSLNFDKKNSTQHLVTPVDIVNQQGIAISVEKIQKSYSSTGGASGGVPGTGENDVPGYPSSTAGGNSNSEDNENRVNYDVNQITNQIVSSPYEVEDLTINVAVEPPVKDNPDSFTPALHDAIQQILKNVVGASLAGNGQTLTDAELDKKVYVFAHSFDGQITLPAKSLAGSPWLYGLAGVALAAIAIGGASLFRRRRGSAADEEEELAQAPQMEFPTLDADHVSGNSQVRKQLESLAKKKPEEFVDLLRTWLVDE